MHRSGTSFITNLSMKIGLDLGPTDKFIAQDKWNQKGYFENSDIVNLNNKIILGDFIKEEYWLIPNHERKLKHRIFLNIFKSCYLFCHNQKHITKRAASKSEELERLSKNYHSIAVKDPRFSILIRYWEKYGNVDRILYCFRHPYEVANSIKKREKLPLWIGYKLWSFHVKLFLNQIAVIKPYITFINFNNFFQKEKNIEEIKRIYHFAGKNFNASHALELLNEVLDISLKNNIIVGKKLPLEVTKTYQLLLKYHKVYNQPLVFMKNNRFDSDFQKY